MIEILHFLRLVLYPDIMSILGNVPYVLEINKYSASVWWSVL